MFMYSVVTGGEGRTRTRDNIGVTKTALEIKNFWIVFFFCSKRRNEGILNLMQVGGIIVMKSILFGNFAKEFGDYQMIL